MTNCVIRETYRSWRGLPLCSLVWLAVFGLALAAAAGERQQLHGQYVPAAGARLAPLGNLPGSQRLTLAIGLPLRNQGELDSLLHDLYDPASPNYRHYLTPEQFTERFGPTEQDYQAVIAFAQANGFTVTGTHPNRTLLDVTASVPDIERAFHVRMLAFQHPTEARTFHAPDVEPSLDMAVPVVAIVGLSDWSLPHPANRFRPIQDVLGKGQPFLASGSGAGGSYMGNDFRSAYAPNTPLNGHGQAVGLFELDGYYPADIATYESIANLASVPLQNVLVDSVSGTPGYSGSSTSNEEVAMDIEVAVSMAPGLSQVIIYEGPLTSAGAYDTLNRMATDNAAKQLSSSWVIEEITTSITLPDQIYQQFAVQGQSFFQASGDQGAYYSGIFQFADDPYITIVGGTALTTTGPGGAWSSETTWNDGLSGGQYWATGGGISVNYSIPSWQQGVSMSANQGSTTKRNSPDVAMPARDIFVVVDSGLQGVSGGTSAAAPLWAGFTALMNQQAVATGQNTVGFLNPAIYALGKSANYASCFHDTTVGNNFTGNSPSKFSAVTGYDLCTGWGSPNGTNLINALTTPPVPVPLIVSNSFALVAEGCPNGVVDPAETVTVNFGLKNTGTGNTTNLVATLLATGGILSPSSPQAYGVLGTNGTAVVLPFSFTATGTCGGTNTATLQLQDGTANLGTVTFSFRLGQTSLSTVFSQNFDGVTAPALPAGWTTATSGAQSAWVTSTSLSDTAPNCAFSPEPSTVGLNELDSPAITLPLGQAQLSFRHRYILQSGRDGGVLEIKIGAGAWTDIVTAGGTFVSGGYNSTLGTSRSNPLPGRQAWSGSISAFTTTLVNLPATAAGQTIQLRWRCGTDSSTGGTGWYVDTVSITNSGYACCTASADLGVALTASPNPALAGQNLAYTLTVTNLGASSASSVTITDALPAGVTFVSASPGCVNLGGSVLCNLGTVPGGGTSNFTVVVTPTATGLITNTLTVASTTADPNSANNTAAIVTTVYVAPAITAQPATQVAIAGSTVTFQVAATGTAPLAFQWRLNGTNLAGASSTTLTLTNVQAAQAGTYTAQVTNAFDSVLSSNAVLTVLVPPAVATQPTNQTVIAGTNASFNVTTTGTAPLGYQWTFNTTPVTGATADTLLLSNVQPAQAGSYAVVVTNVAGAVTSAVASLTVLVPPAVAMQPTNQTVVAGTSASFAVTGTGTTPMGYQWAFDGTNLAGATADTLLLSNVQPAQAGSYVVVITNLAGCATSSVASLTVAPSQVTISASVSAGNGVAITFPSVAGLSSFLEYKDSLEDTNWTPLLPATAGTGGVMMLQDTNPAAPSRFYRLRRQ